MTYETAFTVGERVLIKDLDKQPAVVLEIEIAMGGITYKVAWFHSGNRQTSSVFEHELQSDR